MRAPPGENAPAGSNRSNCGGNETVEASGDKRVTKYGDVASVQAVTRSERRAGLEKDDARADPLPESGKADMCWGSKSRSDDPSRRAGVLATACTQGKRTQHGKPQGVVIDDQPEAVRDRPGALGWRRGL